MAVDISKVIGNLNEFYKFDNQAVISVGAGGGQFVEYGRHARHVIAVDNDEEALNKLKNALYTSRMAEKFTLIHSDFYHVKNKGDVVFFEFCLHEMKDTQKAIKHALTLAPVVLISDHWPGSEWAYIVDEKEKVTKSWESLKKFRFKKIQRYDTVQFFQDYEELYVKVKVQGENSINRISKYKGSKEFTIPMSYGFALI
jgi:ubiquinone/menaquinone biosynthesis C-methylase UbiE